MGIRREIENNVTKFLFSFFLMEKSPQGVLINSGSRIKAFCKSSNTSVRLFVVSIYMS